VCNFEEHGREWHVQEQAGSQRAPSLTMLSCSSVPFPQSRINKYTKHQPIARGVHLQRSFVSNQSQIAKLKDLANYGLRTAQSFVRQNFLLLGFATTFVAALTLMNRERNIKYEEERQKGIWGPVEVSTTQCFACINLHTPQKEKK
jgi:hypothetical protein